MKQLLILFMILLTGVSTFGQRFITKTGHIYFVSEAPLETIEGHNRQVASVLDTKGGDFIFKVLMKSFVFEKALMQEHFNENYVESDKFPNAVFKGKVTNIADIDFKKKGTYSAHVEGMLTIHGESNKVSVEGTFEVDPGSSIHGLVNFPIRIKDYEISVPGAVTGKIAEELVIFVDVNLKPLK